MKKPIIILTTTILLLAIALSMYLLNACQKNVEPIELITKTNVSSYVFNSETYSGISDVEITVDGTLAAKTGADGRFTIPGLKPSSYLIVASKDGYSKGRYQLAVTTDGAMLPQFTLKQLAPPVVIGATGGAAEAIKSSGEQAAELIIPPGELSGDKQVSATNLVGNEVPKILESSNKLLGTTISLTSNDENIHFDNGAQLTFRLPFMHKPGDSVEVTHFNETTNQWETYDNAIVNEDGKSATVTIHHFSTFSANINGKYSEEIDESEGVDTIGSSENYDSIYQWNSSLEYREGITNEIDKEWLYTTVENQTKLNFSDVTYAGNSQSAFKSTKRITMPAFISFYIPPPPNGNPLKYKHLSRRPWILVRQCCWVHEWVEVERFIDLFGGYVVDSIPNWYLVCTFFWVWRYDNTYKIPIICYLFEQPSPPIIIEIRQHQGGSTN